MKNNHFHRIMSLAGIAAGICLVQGCSTMYSGSEAEDMRLRPLPSALEPEPVNAQFPTAEAAAGQYHSYESSAQPVAMPRQQLTTSYTVQKGDNLSSIAYRYRLRWQDVAAVNPKINPNKLFVGEVIQLPGKVDVSQPSRSVKHTASAAATTAGGSYVVKAGDSLSVIAHRHGIKLDALRKANALTSDKIIVGQKLTIPGAKSVAAPKDQKPTIQTPKTPVAPIAPVITPLPTPIPTPAPMPTLDPLEARPPTAPVDAVTTTLEELALPTPGAAIQATPPATTFLNHTVGPDEDIYAVAVRWGVSTAAIKEANNLTSSDLIPGTVLKIPPAPSAH